MKRLNQEEFKKLLSEYKRQKTTFWIDECQFDTPIGIFVIYEGILKDVFDNE